MTSPAPISEIRIVADRLTKRFGDFVAVNAVSFEATARRDHRLPRPQRRGQVDHHPNPVRTSAPERRPGGGRGPRRRALPRARARAHRLHVAEVLALQRSFGDGEPAFLRRRLRGHGRAARRAAEVRHRHGGAQRTGQTRSSPTSPAAGSSASRSAARSCTSRRSCSSTSRPPGSIPLHAGASGTSSIRSPARGVCVVITTHYMDEAEYCNRIALINGGKLAALGSPSELKRSAIHGEILLVEGDNPGAMLEALEGAPGGARRRAVRLVAPHCRRRRGARPAGDRDASQTARKLGWSRIEPIKPTLEDVFVQLVGGDSGAGARPMNLRRVKAIAKKEIIQVWRDPRSLMVVLLMPLMQMALLGYGVNLDIKHVTICIVRPRGQPAERVAHEGLPGVALFRHRRNGPRLQRASSARSTPAAARWRSSFRRTSRKTSRRRIPPRCRRSSTPPTTTPPISRSAMRRRWSARFPRTFKCSERKASGSSRRSPRRSRNIGCGSTRIW